jgi:HD-like signal output (HDOD) protein
MSLASSDTLLKEHVLRIAQKLPASPQIFSRLGLLLADINADLSKVVNLISIDTGLTSRVLRMSNSVFFRGASAVQSLDEAINRVGFSEVHKMVGVAMTEQLFKDGLPAYRLSAKQVWETSVATALAMESIAREAGADEQSAYTAGILRPVGKLVLGRILEKEQPGAVCPDDLDILSWERARLHLTSHEATSYILESWKFPHPTVLAMRFHHEPEAHAADENPLGAQLHLAGWVVAMLELGAKSDNVLWELTPERLHLAGVSEEFMQSCIDDTRTELDALKRQLA